MEIKATAAPRADDAAHLHYLRGALGERFLGGAVLHTGPRAFTLSNRILWHLARRTDYVQATLPAATGGLEGRLPPRPQILDAEGLAARWGLDAAVLGDRKTGMLMDEGAAARMPLPGKDVLLGYARRAFAAAEAAVGAVDDAAFVADRQDRPGETVGNNVMMPYLVHDNRHLGEIECLRGLLGPRGSATR